MSYVYEARHSNGTTYDVPTNNHHSNHGEDDFKNHLLDIIKRSASGVISGYILHFTLKRHG
jgi:hypothetical protein